MGEVWDGSFPARSPMFGPLAALAPYQDAQAWPAVDMLARWAAQRRPGLVSGGGRPLRLVEQHAGDPGAMQYEERIYERGELPVRGCNWHDFFNVLVWLAFPLTKAALNARHHAAIPSDAALSKRGAARDALTLLDESGILILSNDPLLLDHIRSFRWKALFCDERHRLEAALRCYVFGHGLFEKALKPYVGLTAHALLLDVAELPRAADLDAVDALAAAAVADPARFRETRALAPFPVLGMPGWWPQNEDLAFYDNADYFRPGRRAVTRPV